MVPVPTIACPLVGCESEHELRHAKNKAATPYITCTEWGNSTVWFRSPAADDFLNGHNGGRKSNSTPPIRKVNPEEDEMDRFLSGEVQPEEARENPRNVDGLESLLERASKMDNETLARFIEERQRKIDWLLETQGE